MSVRHDPAFAVYIFEVMGIFCPKMNTIAQPEKISLLVGWITKK
jgi:hypothetical protein